jgi:DNA ligase-1
VQLVSTVAGRRLYSRDAEDISAAFPEIIDSMESHAVLDGDLLVIRDGAVAPLADLQQRLNRKTPGARLRADYPVAVRLYDMLFEAADDLRPLPFEARRARLEAWYARQSSPLLGLSELIPFTSLRDLNERRLHARGPGIGGLMLKRADAPYEAGRPRGPWWKWKHDPLHVDTVLMYARRGQGPQAGIYADFTVGVWRDGALVPIGKIDVGVTGQQHRFLDRWVRENTVARYGPVSEVTKALVLEVAFDALQRSTRHKSGLALRKPRIHRIHVDKPAAGAGTVESLLALTGTFPPSSSALPHGQEKAS